MKPAQDWKAFEKLVTEIFSLKGFLFNNDVREAGRQNDIILAGSEEYVGRILIECKFHNSQSESKVGVAEVEAFAAKALRLRHSGDINAAYLVTNSDFTADAKGAFFGRPEGKYLFLRTYQQLLFQLINFRPYYQRFVDQYEDSGLLSKYEPLDLRIRGKGSTVCIDNSVSQFLAETDKNVLHLIIGDFGSGKTTTCNHLFYLLAKDALKDGYAGRLPCLVELRRFNYTGSAQAIVLDYLASKVGIRGILYDVFDAMNKAGLLILILDGFDEMAKRVTRLVRAECFRAIGELCHRQSKVVLTGRPGFFPEDTQMLSAIDLTYGNDLMMKGSGPKRRTNAPVIISSIEPLTEAQIVSFLSKRLDSNAADAADNAGQQTYDRLKEMYNLSELATRPILLEMISTMSKEISKGKVGNVVQLYDLYTSGWLEIDEEKGVFRTLITSQDRLQFSIGLAWGMASGGSSSVHFSQFPDRVAEHFRLEEADDIDHFASDVRTCTFLRRSDSGYYSFVHQSFQEYFCARYVLLGYRNGKGEIRHGFQGMETLDELYSHLPNSFHFLDEMFQCPLSPEFWSSFRGEEFLMMLDRHTIEVEEPWALVEALSSGSIPFSDLNLLLEDIRRLFQGVMRIHGVVALEKHPKAWRANLMRVMRQWV